MRNPASPTETRIYKNPRIVITSWSLALTLIPFLLSQSASAGPKEWIRACIAVSLGRYSVAARSAKNTNTVRTTSAFAQINNGPLEAWNELQDLRFPKRPYRRDNARIRQENQKRLRFTPSTDTVPDPQLHSLWGGDKLEIPIPQKYRPFKESPGRVTSKPLALKRGEKLILRRREKMSIADFQSFLDTGVIASGIYRDMNFDAGKVRKVTVENKIRPEAALKYTWDSGYWGISTAYAERSFDAHGNEQLYRYPRLKIVDSKEPYVDFTIQIEVPAEALVRLTTDAQGRLSIPSTAARDPLGYGFVRPDRNGDNFESEVTFLDYIPPQYIDRSHFDEYRQALAANRTVISR